MTNDELLAKLRERDEAASPGPWSLWPELGEEAWAELEKRGVREATLFGPEGNLAEFDAGSLQQNRHNARLATLAHEVRPLAEALYKIRWETAEPGSPSCEIAEQELARLAEHMEAQDE